MIVLEYGNILEAKAEALVNTVNCVGVMGRGIALQFSKAFPQMFRSYQAACKRGEVAPGKVHTYDLNRLHQPYYVINVPTKTHWRGRSRMEYIEAGLQALVEEIRRLGIQSLAVPPLGCGLGGLNWMDVRPRIERALAGVPNVRVLLFEPNEARQVANTTKRQIKPKMTEGRALLLGLMRRYLAAVMDPTVTLLEIHKLMYFMQETGQKLRLTYKKGHYGPYAENLRHVLEHIEGHFIVGFDDAVDKPDKPIFPKSEAISVSERFLKNRPEVRERFARVGDLIDGFETPYGMELLSTVHWVAKHEGATEFEEAIKKTYRWNDRKRMFKQEHLGIAWETLRRKGWMQSKAN